MSDPDPDEAADVELETVDVIHTESDDYRKVHANGARGGIQPRQDFRLEFILDYRADPDSETFQVLEDGRASDEPIDSEGGGEVIREKQVGVMMSPNQAFSVASWTLAQLLEGASEQDIQELVLSQYEPINMGPRGAGHD